jgi:hypothetical protein
VPHWKVATVAIHHCLVDPMGGTFRAFSSFKFNKFVNVDIHPTTKGK